MSLRYLTKDDIEKQSMDIFVDELVANSFAVGDLEALQVRTDLVVERTFDAGVDVEGVLLKDSNIIVQDLTVLGTANLPDQPNILADTIDEYTLNNGVYVEGVLVKDGIIDMLDSSILGVDVLNSFDTSLTINTTAGSALTITQPEVVATKFKSTTFEGNSGVAVVVKSALTNDDIHFKNGNNIGQIISNGTTTSFNSLDINAINKRSGTAVVVQGTAFSDDTMTMDNGMELIDDPTDDIVYCNFTNKGRWMYDRVLDEFRVCVDGMGPISSEIRITSMTFETRHGLDSLEVDTIDIGEYNAVDVVIHKPLYCRSVRQRDAAGVRLTDGFITMESTANSQILFTDGLQLQSDGTDSSAVSYDSYYNGVSWISDNATSNYQIRKNNNRLNFKSEGGNAIGAPITWTSSADIQTNGDWQFYQDVAIAGNLTVAGSIGVTDSYISVQMSPSFVESAAVINTATAILVTVDTGGTSATSSPYVIGRTALLNFGQCAAGVSINHFVAENVGGFVYDLNTGEVTVPSLGRYKITSTCSIQKAGGALTKTFTLGVRNSNNQQYLGSTAITDDNQKVINMTCTAIFNVTNLAHHLMPVIFQSVLSATGQVDFYVSHFTFNVVKLN